MLTPLDALTVDVLTDNVSDSYVSKTMFAVSEFANVISAGASVISGESLLSANLGFGLRLTSRALDSGHRMLFDTGPEGPTYLRNCANLGIGFADIESIVVTHGHWDHMGALPHTVEAIHKAGRDVTVHVNPMMFAERGALLADGRIVPFAKVALPSELERLGAKVVNDSQPRLLHDDHFYYSGEIPRVTSFEKGRSDHMRRESPDSPWEHDPLLLDERFLAAHVRGLGLIIFSACSHAGIVNVCTHARTLFPDLPLHCVMGGLHLGGVMEPIIPATVEALRPFNIRNVITGHCTGWRALHALAEAFGDSISQSAVGTTYTFAA